MAVSGWTAASRITGFGRVVVVAAVLGPTYLGNVFQASNNLPNLVYMALIGALISSLLVPPLVRLVDEGDRAATERLAGAFLGTALLVFGVAAVLVVLAGPLILQLLTVGVPDVEEAAGQRAAGRLLLLLCMPQLVLYGVVGTCEAVMNAHGRFALPSAAPISENLGVILTMVVTGLIYGMGEQQSAVQTEQLVLMGAGCTMAVAVHAAIDWWGVRRLGVRLIPRAGWREPAVREIIRRAVPSMGYSGLDVAQQFAIVVIANRIPGGVVAFDLAMNFYVLPAALGARPVGVALLPQLSRLTIERQMGRFRDELVRGASLMFFLAVPAAVGLAVLAGPIAESITFGAMASAEGRAMLNYALLGLSVGVIGECAMLLCTYASYARSDIRSPLLAMLIRLGIASCGIGVALTLPLEPALLLALGLTVSIADLGGAAFLALRLRSALPSGNERLLPSILRSATAAIVAVIPALAVATFLPALLPRVGPLAGVVAACLLGVLSFLLLQVLLRSPELKLLSEALRRRGAAADA
jgi:putative peptidoglycan lipid II flippase